jgi:hypothetical protein
MNGRIEFFPKLSKVVLKMKDTFFICRSWCTTWCIWDWKYAYSLWWLQKALLVFKCSYQFYRYNDAFWSWRSCSYLNSYCFSMWYGLFGNQYINLLFILFVGLINARIYSISSNRKTWIPLWCFLDSFT